MASLHALDIIERKRDGGVLSAAQIRSFVHGVVDQSISRPQAAAFLMAVFVRGMQDAEIVALTLAMRDSGQILDWAGLAGPFVDKHSTGGVGDKVSLPLAPLWAALGARVPMISGRGLGHTGGTLDKLEAIPGMRVDLPIETLRKNLDEVGCFICGQTGDLAPADRTLYALRNETGTVPSIPLIVASILSKKLSEGIGALVMDVKWGSGAFMKTRDDARALADRLVSVGQGAGVDTRAVLSEMNQPLGETVGNALEVQEAVDCLKGGGPPELSALVCDLIGDPLAKDMLASGAAYERWARMVRAQGGDPDAPLLGAGCEERIVRAKRAGTITRCDALQIGRAAFVLGAGRARAADPIHPGVGVRVLRKIGDDVAAGEALAVLVHAEKGVDEAVAMVQGAYRLDGDEG
ncbi:MAG: thymidine phosphorylase [Myxococcota bacterium]